MSALAELPVRERAPAGTTDPERLKYGSALSAVSELGAGGLSGLDLRDAMRLIATRACSVLKIARCAIYLRDDRRDVFVGCAAHPGAELEEAVRHLTLGGPSDRVTREIVDTCGCLLIRDVRSDPRGLTAAIRAWKLRSLLGVPLVAGEQILGVMMLDNGPDLHPYAPVDVEIASAFAALAASAVGLARESSELRSALETATRQNKLLRRTAVAEQRLSAASLKGGGLGAIVELVACMTGKPAALYDTNGQPVVKCSPQDGGDKLAVTLIEDTRQDPAISKLLRDTVAGGSATIEPVIDTGVRRRHLAAPVDVRGERWGWLVVMEHPCRLGAFDDFLARRAATHLALELAGRCHLTAMSVDARGLLARQLVRGTTIDDDLRRGAEYLGVALAAHRVVAYLSVDEDAPETAQLVEQIRIRVGSDVLASHGPEGIALLVEVADSELATRALRRIKEAIGAALAQHGALGIRAGISSVCRTPAELPSGYRVARQVARCIENFPLESAHTVLAADDLGPGRLFVANGQADELQRFVEDILGSLLQDDEASTDLVRTLEAFYDTGRSVRLASERLGVHENTVRYRLARIHSITGLDVAGDADDQLSVQVALLVLRLQGHPALHSFASAASPSERSAEQH